MDWWLNVIANILQIITSIGFFVAAFTWARNVVKEHSIGSKVLIAVLGLSILVSIASLTEKIGWWPSHKPEQVFNKHFSNEVVILDDHEYFNCTF